MTQATRDPAKSPPSSDRYETARDYPLTPLHALFEAQAAATPRAIALRFRDETLSYAELDRRATLLARRLAAHGAGPGELVAVCMERSIEMVVSIYAVLKAGAAYVPIDPDYPAERVAFMLGDADAAIVLTQSAVAARIALDSARVIVVDGADAAAEADLPGEVPHAAGPDDLAYVIYTSGSTGQPKGAMISHRAITNRLHWMQEAYRLTPADRVLQKTPFSFDVSVWELFWPLLFGAELVIAEPGGHRDSGYLTRTINERGITTIHFVPSMLQLFLDDPAVATCGSLERVICSGEALPRALQDRFFERLDASLYNLYGPTEAAVDVTAWTCDPASDLPFVPIGRPIANTRIHILDEGLRPVDDGVTGELYIGGVQVARGYLHRPELTAERFTPDPFSDDDDARLYRTGDLARYLPDGNVEFLGRNDSQVKIRGFRVELGEIEAVLESAPGVRQAVVVARERPNADHELVAYVTLDADADIAVDDLRTTSRARLPEAMVPTAFVRVESFPLTANGKIDRAALPSPPRLRPRLGAPYAPPRSALERLIAAHWRDILELDRVGVDDRFFELGGSSLQAARFVNQMQSDLGESIFVVTLFSAPSVAGYAAFLAAEYPEAVRRLTGHEAALSTGPSTVAPITEADLASFRAVVPSRSEREPDGGPANPPAVFVLSPPRSGTTLLRIMLAGHPDLFSASELQLLGFSSLGERAAAFTGADRGWLDGTVRAIMQIDGVGAREARARMSAAEAEGLSTKAFYRRLQASVHPRMLVDKSPSYALDPATLRSAEVEFEGARYIHLVRDPVPMIESFERHHMEQVLYLHEHTFASRQLAELVWTVSHRNIVDFLASVPEERWVRVRFEELVRRPEMTMRALCDGLDLRFDGALLRPYDGLDDKMIDGVHAESAPMGDPGFLAHGRIDPDAAAGRTATGPPVVLGAQTRELAAALGYVRIDVRSRQHPSGRRRSLASQRGRRQTARSST